MIAFSINNLKFRFNKSLIFSDLTISQNESQIALWQGPSGVGKSTLALLVCGHLKPYSGHIECLNHLAKPQKDVFYVSHENDLFSWLTLESQINFLKKEFQATDPISESYVQEILELLEVDHLLNSYPSEMSMGQIRRVQLLRPLILKSKIIFLDETLSSLDQNLKKKIFSNLKLIWSEQNTTVVVISHEEPQDFQFDVKWNFSAADDQSTQVIKTE